MTAMHRDFLEFLKLLKSHNIQYLLVGGYAVSYHGYPRMTMDMDLWVKNSRENSIRIVEVIREFGFQSEELRPGLFENPESIIRMGVKPQLIEILTSISGVEFDECYKDRIITEIDGIEVNIISLNDLKRNKTAAGRPKDLADLDYL